MDLIPLIVSMVVMVGMTFLMSRKDKKKQEQLEKIYNELKIDYNGL